MNVVHITNAGGSGRIQWGGAERGVAELTSAVAARWPEIDVHVIAPGSFLEQASLDDRITGWPVSFTSGRSAFRRVMAILHETRPDVAVTHLLRATLIGQPAAALGGVPRRISVLHNSLSQAVAPLPQRRAWLYRIAFSTLTRTLTDATVAISRTNVSDLTARDRVQPRKVAYVPNWVAERFDLARCPEWRSATRSELGLSADDRVIGMFARLEPQKRPLFLIELLPRIGDAHLVVGGEGSLRVACEDAAERLGVRDRVHFIGFRPQVERWMSACDAVAIPSQYEGFGRAAVEALALGIPVVASNVDGLPDVLRGAPPAGARLLEPEDSDGWARALQAATAAATSESLRKELHEYVASRFSLERAVEAWKRLYVGEMP